MRRPILSRMPRPIGVTMTLALLGGAACENASSEDVTGKQSAVTAASTPSTAPELDPTTIPRFQTNLRRNQATNANRPDVAPAV